MKKFEPLYQIRCFVERSSKNGATKKAHHEFIMADDDEAAIEKFKAWKADHPNGIDRLPFIPDNPPMLFKIERLA